MEAKVTTEGSQEIRHCSRLCFWYISYNSIGMRAPISSKHFPRRTQGGLQGWTTGRKKCTNGSKMGKLCQVQTKIICVPLFMPLQKAVLSVRKDLHMDTVMHTTTHAQLRHTQPQTAHNCITMPPKACRTWGDVQPLHAGWGNNKYWCPVWDISQCVLSCVPASAGGHSKELWECAEGPVMSLWKTVWNQICLTACKTPVWFREVRSAGEFKSLFQGDCLFIWTILWTKIEASISHEECYPLGTQMNIGCLRDQSLAVPLSCPFPFTCPFPAVCLLAAIDLESAEDHAEQFSTLKPQQINPPNENKFSSIKTGDWHTFCAGSDSHQKVLETST